jgi:hypothetical protein
MWPDRNPLIRGRCPLPQTHLQHLRSVREFSGAWRRSHGHIRATDSAQSTTAAEP